MCTSGLTRVKGSCSHSLAWHSCMRNMLKPCDALVSFLGIFEIILSAPLLLCNCTLSS
jgi:hypothetical protein